MVHRADLAEHPVLQIKDRLVRRFFKFEQLFVPGLQTLIQAALKRIEQFALLLL